MPNLPCKLVNYFLPRALVKMSTGCCLEAMYEKEIAPASNFPAQNDSQAHYALCVPGRLDFQRCGVQPDYHRIGA